MNNWQPQIWQTGPAPQGQKDLFFDQISLDLMESRYVSCESENPKNMIFPKYCINHPFSGAFDS